jgi:RNA polymerase-binding transcription factor DksA
LKQSAANFLLGSSNREIRIENAAENFDRLQQRMNREVAIRNLDRELKLLKGVEEALSRIESGALRVKNELEIRF